ncbi:MAG: ribbon-helix-helix protein, CopG family [Candidatus Lokiarchaeota archaeon]|nr:ribbon-helix-helix protein, CopG family [Candidatus Lokiarchaeota archaeon]
MSQYPPQKSLNPKKSSSERKNKVKDSTSVITVRIDEDLNSNINKLKKKLGTSKADLIRNYLEMSKFIIKQKTSIKSLNDRDCIIIKRSFFRKLIDTLEEVDQMELGIKIARFINDIARLQGLIDNIEYKLDLCEHLGFFPKLIDEDKYILFSKKFGSKKFSEAFVYKLINHEPKSKYNTRYTEEAIGNNKSLRTQYKKEINPAEERSASHYAFEFAKLPKGI